MNPLPIVVVSDLHVNSTVGLFPPDVIDIDGTPRPQNRVQQWLWNRWLEFARDCPEQYVLFINGDVVQGIHPAKDAQIVTTSPTTMRLAAKMALEPLLKRAKGVYLIRGTGWHGGAGGSDEEEIARDIGAVKINGQQSHWELYIEHGGLLFFFTHHISFAPVYPKTPMAREFNSAKMQFVDKGIPIPDVMVRSHRHKFDKLPDGKRWMFVTPCWQLSTEFLFKNHPMSLPDIGGLIFHVDKGRFWWEEKIYNLPKPTIIHV